MDYYVGNVKINKPIFYVVGNDRSNNKVSVLDITDGVVDTLDLGIVRLYKNVCNEEIEGLNDNGSIEVHKFDRSKNVKYQLVDGIKPVVIDDKLRVLYIVKDGDKMIDLYSLAKILPANLQVVIMFKSLYSYTYKFSDNLQIESGALGNLYSYLNCGCGFNFIDITELCDEKANIIYKLLMSENCKFYLHCSSNIIDKKDRYYYNIAKILIETKEEDKLFSILDSFYMSNLIDTNLSKSYPDILNKLKKRYQKVFYLLKDAEFYKYFEAEYNRGIVSSFIDIYKEAQLGAYEAQIILTYKTFYEDLKFYTERLNLTDTQENILRMMYIFWCFVDEWAYVDDVLARAWEYHKFINK